jgi:hypothetical protein
MKLDGSSLDLTGAAGAIGDCNYFSERPGGECEANGKDEEELFHGPTPSGLKVDRAWLGECDRNHRIHVFRTQRQSSNGDWRQYDYQP